MIKVFLASLNLLACTAIPATAEWGAGAGLVGFGGLGARAHWHQPEGHWRLGLQYGRVPDYKFDDPFTGRPLTLEKEIFFGPFVNYQFKAGRAGSWYAGLSMLYWWRKEKAMFTGEWNTDSTVDPYLGVGYLRRFGRKGFYDLGIFIAPWARQRTSTSVSSTENDGAADLRAHVGFVW